MTKMDKVGMSILKQYGASERFIAEASIYPAFHLARVTAQHKGGYQVVTE